MQRHARTCTTSIGTPWVNSAVWLLIFIQPRAGTTPEPVWPWECSDPARSWGWHRVWDRLLCNTSWALPLPAATSSQGPQLCSYCTDGEGLLPFNTPQPGSWAGQPWLAANLSQAFKAEMGLLKSSQSNGRRSQICSGLFSQTLGQCPSPPTVLRDYKAEAARKSVWRRSFMSHALLGLGSSQP